MLGVKKNKRKDANNEREKIEDTTQSDEGKNNRVNDDEPVKQPKYGPILTFPYQKVWSRSVLILCVLAVVWYNSKRGKEIFLAKQKEVLVDRAQRVECAPEYKTELDKFPGCVPERCGRVVNDKLVSSTETDVLLKIAAAGMNLGGSDGGASILDLHSGALSKGTGFINIYNHPRANKIFSNADFAIYKVVKTKIHHAVAHHFGVDANNIYLTKPTFFSRMTNAPAKTVHDEYWLPHVDKVTYQHFHYTSLLYLNDHGRDFEGGRLIFIDDNNVTTSIEPRKGRVTMFTSGAENLHAVERVTSGTRYALTVSFTCDPIAAISDPKLDTSKS
ncbi:2-oxoglutarate and iron-dependent oxygenase domain-containing protein 3-like isoform X1 [Venturia canescens]|uniref:2-oxoglutarate and iron-dependent oxygenase domain-containing protein 3-like isoform X1 n=1 Tax=Venturia canescens TaxID=32260 RepID=UPI001C9C746C|nr:2-oxoglutarate and iron-dependent oxygenase domain-containing protein 3-like isoform X1 [Venturia canescens]